MKLPSALSVPLSGVVFRQRLDDEIESKPQAPTVMVEKNRKNQGHDEEQDQHVAVVSPNNQQEKETDQQDHELRCDHIRQYRADKKPFFTLKEGQAVRTVMPDVKRM